ncbi:putative laccase precursor protein [Phaeoacremonium minimum UCRPA7]|uniref:laccase n=1 Tax=Phaeoacremonium minimum (strain UCR-PA7) TaxID=1286976 RepID=R8BVQ5_PHAM7|nr:putative laccase precursor protein [Phaeoacremonium minimum UCRPA7]EOO03476.1 putative laccase precursor protein [Phaeoacremonium minimum UCRPA7]
MPNPQVASRAIVTCGQNEAHNRACWKNRWDINTDYENITPDTGNTRTFDLRITNVTEFALDGVLRRAMLINNQYPGPAITADWGDMLHITVHNELTDNGTSIHWHGMRQLHTNNQDGANGVTECPIPPGESRTYSFRATQYGTSWYHSHFSTQYGNGVVGPLVINGPASADYDLDLGPYVVSDTYHFTSDVGMLMAEMANKAPPKSDNILFNGQNINTAGEGGSYNKMTLIKGKKHRLRIINTSVENHFTLSLVGHNFTVIATDMVPVRPVVKSQIFVAVGQRYDVIIDASQEVGNYWFNATLSKDGLCGASKNLFPAAIFSYSGADDDVLPTDQGTPVTADCHDTTGFVPVVSRTASLEDWQDNNKELDINLTTVVTGRGRVFQWQVNSSAMDVTWERPILSYIREGNTSYPTAGNAISLDKANVWTYWVIANIVGLPHPIHLHGHDFLVLGTADKGHFDPAADMDKLNFKNPVRRDVAMLPGGWLVIAFKTDNPGAWLMHCHIAWHVSQGLSVQFLERTSEIATANDLSQLQPNCDSWKTYHAKAFYPKLDSGL